VKTSFKIVDPDRLVTKLGTLDGDLCIWSDHGGAVVLINGAWRHVDLWTVYNEAKINHSPGYLLDLLRSAPPLPTATPTTPKVINAIPFNVIVTPQRH
jgi:hypothetical protein